MDFRVLQYFLAVAREESITGAAKMLHVTQPTLSRQLADLEQELNTTLFTRGTRKITLTEDGLLLRKRAQEIVDLVQKTEADLLAPDDTINGDVYIGGGETYAMERVAKVVRQLRTEQPGIRFHFFSGNADDVTERLDKGLLDFGVVIEPVSLSKYDSIRLPDKDTWGLLMRRDSPLAEKQTITPADILEVPLLGSRQTMVSEDFTSWLGRDFATANLVATYNLVYNASLLVAQGVGYALCLDKLINTTGDSKLCFRPLAPRLEAGLYVVWKKYQVFNKAAELFLEKLRIELAGPEQ